MRELAFCLTFMGYGTSSGGAVKQANSPDDVDSADEAFLRGALDSPYCNPATSLRIYLINARWERYRPNPNLGFYDSLQFPDTWNRAYELMIAARGSAAGLGDAGMKLHTRNVYQVLGHDLQTPVRRTVCYARPIGNGRQFKGGTNTAIQLSFQHNIPVMNLYEDEQVREVQRFIASIKQRYADSLIVG